MYKFKQILIFHINPQYYYNGISEKGPLRAENYFYLLFTQSI